MVFFPFLRVQRYIFFLYKACFEEKYFIWCMIFCFMILDILCHRFQVSGFKFQITNHKKIVSLPPRKNNYQTQ